LNLESPKRPIQPVLAKVVSGIFVVDYVVIPKQKRKPVIMPYHASNIHKQKSQCNIQIRIFEKRKWEKQPHSLEGTF
jgi:hypothetical protein